MANKPIPNLTAASTPLAGDEDVHIVQSGNSRMANVSDLVSSATVNAAGAVMNSDTSVAAMSFAVDEDDMASDLDTKFPTQQSVKAYHDAGAATLANKTIDSANNTLTLDLSEGTLTGTAAEFDAACSDGDFFFDSDATSDNINHTTTETGGVARTVQAVLSDFIILADFDCIPGNSAGDNETGMQAAVNTISNGDNGVIFVPPGTYAGDFEANVDIGTRNILWFHLGEVTYSTSPPYGVQFGFDAAPDTAGSVGFNVPGTDVSWLNKPTLSLRRVTSHTTGIAGTAEPGPLYITHEIDSAVENYETAVYVVIDVNTALGSAESMTAGRFQARKYNTDAGGANLFGLNPSCQDTTTRKSSVSGGVLVGMEVDLVASGPDDASSRRGVDVVTREYDTSADGTTSFATAYRAIPSGSGAAANIKTAYWAGANGNGIVNVGVELDEIEVHGILMTGDAPTTAAIQAVWDDANKCTQIYGSGVTSGVTADIYFRADNNAGTSVNYARIAAFASASATGAHAGSIQLSAWSGAAEQVGLTLNPNADSSNPFNMRVNGALKKVTAGASDSGGSGFRALIVPN